MEALKEIIEIFKEFDGNYICLFDYLFISS